jgi:uncharacterized protein (TIGR03000 family)
MQFCLRGVRWAGLAAILSLAVPQPGYSQVYGRIGVQYSTPPGYPGVDAPSAYYPRTTSPDMNGYPPRSYASIATGTLPTYLTSINYPWMYGAYGYYYAPGSRVFGAMPSQGTLGPTIYGTYLPPENSLYAYRVIPDTASTPLVTTANINVIVPPDAELRFDGTLTGETGNVRHFVTPTLIPGNSYAYDVSATWLDNGHQVTSDRHVTFQTGEHLTIDFTTPPPAPERTSTLRAAPTPRP